MSAVRWGILGAAGINEAMAPAIAAASNAELVAIASRTAERAEAAAERFGAARAVEGYDALLADPDIEAVYIPLPNAFHLEWTLRAAAAGKHVLCEKPMAITASDARAMIAACDAAGVLLAEAFMYAHHPRYARIAEIIDSGEIGTPHAILTTFSFDASDELDHSGFQGLPGSGSVYDVGCYAVHSARMLLKREPRAVTARATESALHGDIDLATSALVEFDGATLLFHVDMAAADTDVLEVIGSAGRIVVPHAFICSPGDGDFRVETAAGSRVESADAVDHYRVQVETFSRAVGGDGDLLLDPSDAERNAAALEAITLSWRDGRRVLV
ncbi:MAG: Gfo/Idh/MocA family oxidoreductase [Microbacteriaceae bacterium]|nr:Gfo/Idh/MocA family oxidoreductase [Microbacteriaceae bacterium]